jgi:hypothetical protein
MCETKERELYIQVSKPIKFRHYFYFHYRNAGNFKPEERVELLDYC